MKTASFLRTTVVCFLTLCATITSAHAVQDIVYSARYYNRPGTRGTSHYHLYRINADGTGRRQITSGARDDIAPQWSPDGKKVLFVRRDEDKSQDTLALVNAAGGRVKSLRTFSTTSLDYYRWSPRGDAIAVACLYSKPPDTRLLPVVVLLDRNGNTVRAFRGGYSFTWSPDGDRILVRTDKADRIYEGSKSTRLAVRLSSATWLDKQTLVGIVEQRDDVPEGEKPWAKLQVLGANGKLNKTVMLKYWSESELDEADLYPTFLRPRPASRRTFTVAYDTSNSTVDPLFLFCLADSQSGQMKLLTEGQFLEWAPDGQRFCTAPGQDLAVYGKHPDGRQRLVWVSPLQIGMGTSQKFTSIVSGLVYVAGANWRGTRR